MLRKIAWLSVALMSPVPAAHAGWLGGTLLGTMEKVTERAVRETAEAGYERARDAFFRGGDSGGVAGRDPGGGGASGRGNASARVSAPGPGDGASAARAITPSEVASRYDFLPGDRVMFFDDFRDTRAGDFPRRWTLNGPDISGLKAPLEVVRYGGRRWVRYRSSNDRKDAASSFYARLDCGKDMPEKFTVEFDAVLPPFDGTDQKPEYRLLLIHHGERFRQKGFGFAPSNVVRIGSIGASSGKTNLAFERGDGQVHHVAVAVDGSSVKAFLDEDLVVNDPEGIVRPVTVIGMELAFQTGTGFLPLMFTNFRVAAVGKEMRDTPETDGRIATRPNDPPDGREGGRRVETERIAPGPGRTTNAGGWTR